MSEQLPKSENIKLSHSEVQHRLFEMLDKFDLFCAQKGFRYYLADGTLLGAIRHNGFIPWDDDLDVLMPREDYEKFILYDAVDDEVDIVSYKNSHLYYHPYIYCNLADKTTVIKESNVKQSTGKGLFIDVFPLDGVPDNRIIRYSYIKRVCFLRALINCSNRQKLPISSLKSLAQNVVINISSHINVWKTLERLDHLLKKYPFKDCRLCTELVDGTPNRNIWQKKDFETTIKHQFEEREFSIPAGYAAILTVTYGDYMTLPPEADRVGHHGICVYERTRE